MAPNHQVQAEWESHRDELKLLWIEQDWGAKQIQSFMAEKHGFKKSESQYRRWFDKWGYKKNCRNSDWAFVAHRQEKRKREGKDPGEVWKNKKIVPESKVRKEIARHVKLSSQYTATEVAEPQTPEGIMVCTPQPSMDTEAIKSPDRNMLDFFPSTHLELVIPDDFLRLSPNLPQVQYEPSQVEIPDFFSQESGAFITTPYIGGSNMDYNLLEPGFTSSSSSQELNARIQECSDLMGSEILEETRSILMKSNAFDKQNCRSFLSALEPITIDDDSGSLEAKAEFMFNAPNSDKLSLFMHLCIFLSSNNLLPQKSTESLVRLIQKGRAHSTLQLLIKSKSTAIEIFMSNLLAGAAAVGDVAICQILIHAGADIDATNGPDLQTPLLYALRRDNFQCAKMLLEACANPNFAAAGGERPLHVACQYCRDSDSVKLLLQYKADVNPPTIRRTPLQIAARRGRSDLVRLLLDKGADPDLTSLKDPTALQIACYTGWDATMVDLLVVAGAAVDMRPDYDSRGKFHSMYDDRTSDSEDEDWHGSETSDSDDSDQYDYETDYFKNEHWRDGIPIHFKPAILIAAECENWEAVQLLLEEGAKIDIDWTKCSSHLFKEMGDLSSQRDEAISFTPLQAAVKSGNITMARMLLRAGANIDGRPRKRYGWTPVQLCAAAGNQRLIEILMRKGGDINAPAGEFFGRTALQAAASHSDVSVLSFLIEEGADPNGLPADQKGLTALQAAVKAANVEAVQLLLDAGANVNTDRKLTDGVTAIGLAFDITDDVSRDEILGLLRRAGADYKAAKGLDLASGLLHSAVRRRDVKTVQSLLESGKNSNIGYCRITKRTPLQQACYDGNEVIVRLLTDHGAQVNAAPWRAGGYTALQAASLQGHTTIAKLLLKLGANVNSLKSGDGYSAVELAVKCSRYELIPLFLDSSPDAISSDAICKARIIGLFLKSQKIGKDKNIVEATLKLLVNSGANVNGAGESYLQEAVCSRELELVRCLILAGADINWRNKSSPFSPITALQQAAYMKDVRIAQLLLECGADVNSPANGEGGNTALQAAAMNLDLPMLRLLMSFGADINGAPSPKRGRTALQWAVSKGSLPITHFLISNGADLNAPPAPSQGCTALQAAALQGNIRIVQRLISAGVCVNEAPAAEDGRSATEAAAEYGRIDTLHMLLDFYPDTEDFDIVRRRAARFARANGRVAIERFLLAYRKGSWKK
ncbi:ankyrin repeat-containing domain protein [Penicillium malachiteum]|nr:ankyrin repeat-containing domain protein [Penicillium malachiteum]